MHARFATLPLLLLLTVLASTARSMAQPVFAYALTTPTSPVQPGQIVRFTVKVTNRAGTLQNLRELDFQVPAFTEYVFPSAANAPLPSGSAYHVGGANVPPGASVLRNVDVTVLPGSQSPPAGSVITLVLLDPDTGASVSCSVTVR